MSEHTPGPWSLDHQNSGGGQNIVDQHRRHVAHTSCFIDHNERHGGSIGDSEALANASLIAAAPDMLAALRAAESYIGGQHIDQANTAAYRIVGAAITKATGGQP